MVSVMTGVTHYCLSLLKVLGFKSCHLVNQHLLGETLIADHMETAFLEFGAGN